MIAWLWKSCTVLPHQSLHLSMTEACVRTDPDITNWESCSCSPPVAKLERAGPVPHLASTIEPTLMVEAWVSQPQSCECGRPVPTICLSYLSVLCGIVRDFPLTPPHLLLPPTVERDQPQHSGNGSCYSARQHSRAPWRLELRVTQTQRYEQSSAVPIIHQTCSSMGRGKIPSPHLMPINF